MFQKLTPIIILFLFAIGTYFMITQMNKATQIGMPKIHKIEKNSSK